MIAEWPTELPKAPLLEGYSSEYKDSRFVSNVSAGLNKVRNRYRAIPKDVSESFVMNNAQKIVFDDFHLNTLGNGAERFLREDPEDGVVKSYRITDTPSREPLGADKDGPVWRISFDAEVLPE